MSPWHMVSVDLLGSYPQTNMEKLNILVIADTFTRWLKPSK